MLAAAKPTCVPLRLSRAYANPQKINMYTSSTMPTWLLRNTLLCFNIESTSVVLPWSTWAMMAMLRTSSRVTSPSPAGGAGAAATNRARAGGGVSAKLGWQGVRSARKAWVSAKYQPLGGRCCAHHHKSLSSPAGAGPGAAEEGEGRRVDVGQGVGWCDYDSSE